MNVIKKLILTDDDKQLLSQPFPISPCSQCSNVTTCCGCKATMEYDAKIKQYKTNGIYEYAKCIDNIRHINQEIENLSKYKEDIIAEQLPSELLEFI